MDVSINFIISFLLSKELFHGGNLIIIGLSVIFLTDSINFPSLEGS